MNNANGEPSLQDQRGASSVDALADELEKAELQPTDEILSVKTQYSKNMDNAPIDPLIVYSREQLIHLSNSPLVKPPDGMPAFKSFFGEFIDQSGPSSKKELEAIAANGAARERRYRREAEDGDAPNRQSFRSALSQPSQMGNFKHQPLRSSDRDKDNTERELRTLSDKFDRERNRDRVMLSSNTTLLRNRDRESSHLLTERDSQRTSNRRRAGETKDDWRRDHPRRERDDRERPRSRVRDSSTQRNSPPAPRRDKDELRRDRDRERFVDAEEEGRSWRDDGKWEERMAARRDREKDRGQDRSRERNNDRGHRDGREEDRKEREKEKEPAWMETYIPPPSASGGILGGKGEDGEVDSIQAWKRDMKEREMKAKNYPSEAASNVPPSHETLDEPKSLKMAPSAPESQMDEIQLFKLLMKQEEQKRSSNADRDAASEINAQLSADSAQSMEHETGDVLSGNIDPLLVHKNASSLFSSSASGTALTALSASTTQVKGADSLSGTATVSMTSGPRLLPHRTAKSGNVLNETQPQAIRDSGSVNIPFDPPRQSRLLAFGIQNPKMGSQVPVQNASGSMLPGRVPESVGDPLWPSQRRPSVSPVIPMSHSQQVGLQKLGSKQQSNSGPLENTLLDNAPRRSGVESVGPASSSSDIATRSALLLDREFSANPDMLRSSSIPLTSSSERTAFATPPDGFHHLIDNSRNPTPPSSNYNMTSPISPFDNQANGTQSFYSTGKGSRMAKHFEKSRDFQAANIVRPTIHGLGTNGMLPGRQGSQGFNGSIGGTENRHIDDLLAMLTNSAQAQRAQQLNAGIGQNVMSQQQQHAPPPPLHLNHSGSVGRHDSLLDLDEGRFAPDGLVPGLRTALPPPPPRNRDSSNGNVYANQLEESMVFNARLGGQQRNNLEQLFSGPIPSQFNAQGPNVGRGNLPFQQQTMRGGPSPINNFNPLQGAQQQRLPPGLANLGGRPPHEPSQFPGNGAGNFVAPSQLHTGLQHSNNTVFNQFQGTSGVAGNHAHIRGQPSLNQVATPIGPGVNGIDFRAGPGGPPQTQMLGVGGHGNMGQAFRGGPSINAQQLHNLGQLPPSINMRQHNLPPQMLPHMLPPQLQQHGLPNGQHTPNELMALLMGGTHRE